ncbi:unnamed protein product, partial [Ectocarpus sp. 12 AP-2014]
KIQAHVPDTQTGPHKRRRPQQILHGRSYPGACIKARVCVVRDSSSSTSATPQTKHKHTCPIKRHTPMKEPLGTSGQSSPFRDTCVANRRPEPARSKQPARQPNSHSTFHFGLCSPRH